MPRTNATSDSDESGRKRGPQGNSHRICVASRVQPLAVFIQRPREARRHREHDAGRCVGTQEEAMRTLMTAVVATMVTAAPLFAQEGGGPNAKGFITGLGGFASSLGETTGNVMVEGGVRIAPHVMIFGNGGRFGNLQADLQPTLDAATAALSASQGLSVTGGGSLPAWYTTGGVRVEVPAGHRILPYVLGSVGVARLNPSAQFTFSGGTLPDRSTPEVGSDV